MEGAGPAACASASPLRMNARDNKSGRWAAGLCVRRPAAHHPKMPRSPVLKCPRCALLLGRRADGRAENGVFQQSRVQNGAQRARGILACAAAQGAAHPGHRGAPCKAAGAPPPHPPARPAHFIAAAQPAVCCLDSLERKLFPSESQPWCPADFALPAPAQAPRRCGTRTRWSSSTTSPSASALR